MLRSKEKRKMHRKCIYFSQVQLFRRRKNKERYCQGSNERFRSEEGERKRGSIAKYGKTVDQFKESNGWPFAVVERTTLRKKPLVWVVLGVSGAFGKANSSFGPSQQGQGLYHHVVATAD